MRDIRSSLSEYSKDGHSCFNGFFATITAMLQIPTEAKYWNNNKIFGKYQSTCKNRAKLLKKNVKKYWNSPLTSAQPVINDWLLFISMLAQTGNTCAVM